MGGMTAAREHGVIMNPFTKGKTASRTGNAVLKDADIRRIRELAKTHTTRDLSEAYNVGMETIRKIVRRDSWKWVADLIPLDMPLSTPSPLEYEAATASAQRVQEHMAKAASEPTAVEKLNKTLQTAVAPGLDVLKELESAEVTAAKYGARK